MGEKYNFFVCIWMGTPHISLKRCENMRLCAIFQLSLKISYLDIPNCVLWHCLTPHPNFDVQEIKKVP